MASDLLTKDLITYDPLSDTTRKERTSLLGLSMLGVALVKVPLVPTKFSALGVEFNQLNQSVFVQLYALVVGYYLIAFVVYAGSDFVAWRRQEVINHHEYEAQRRERRTKEQVDLDTLLHGKPPTESVRAPTGKNLKFTGLASYSLGQLVSRIRAVLEFAVPVFFAAYTLCVLLRFVAKP